MIGFQYHCVFQESPTDQQTAAAATIVLVIRALLLLAVYIVLLNYKAKYTYYVSVQDISRNQNGQQEGKTGSRWLLNSMLFTICLGQDGENPG